MAYVDAFSCHVPEIVEPCAINSIFSFAPSVIKDGFPAKRYIPFIRQEEKISDINEKLQAEKLWSGPKIDYS